MTPFLQNVLGGLVLAGVSGLVFLAYEHPKGYQRIYIWLRDAVAMVWVALIGREIGFMESELVATRVFGLDGSDKLSEGLQAHQFGVFPVLVVGFGILVFLLFLALLPVIIYGNEGWKYLDRFQKKGGEDSSND